MKHAGSKNDGAWFRANKVISMLDGTSRVTLGGLIAGSDFSDLAFTDIQSYADETGVTDALTIPTSKEEWIAAMMAHGIPRQVWNGRWSTTTYALVAGKRKANYQVNNLQFAKDLRRIVRNFIFALREAKDLLNIVGTGVKNPGGLPDAHQGT